MTVYGVWGKWDYEGNKLIQLFTSKEGADKCLQKHLSHPKKAFSADDYYMEEHEVSQE